MSRLRTACLLLVVACVVVQSQNGIIQDGQGKRVLALLDNYGIRETHSIFFKSLRDRGFQITFKPADDPDLALSKYGEYLFDHLILFSPNVVEFGGNITSKSVIDFIDDGGNVLVAASSQITEPLKEIAAECGVEFSDEGTYVIDRFNTDANDDGRNTLIISETENLINNELLVGKLRSSSGAPFLYKGVGMSIDSENPLLLEVLTASATAYAYKPDEPVVEYPHSIGKSTLLITALQARNNARVVFVGSLDFFSNDFFEAPVQKSGGKRFEKSGNEALSNSLTQWTFKEKGVLRVVSVDHHLVGEKTPPAAYTIKQNLIYSIKIEEVVNGKWQPFQNTDVQLEFIRLDPFVRQTLKPSASGVFTAQFQVPDVYGIYKFNVEYNRIGYTNLFSTTQVSVRPFQHIEYDRFIPAAFPYYASAFSMMLAVFFFSFIQLYHHDSETKTATTADKSGIQSPQK